MESDKVLLKMNGDTTQLSAAEEEKHPVRQIFAVDPSDAPLSLFHSVYRETKQQPNSNDNLYLLLLQLIC